MIVKINNYIVEFLDEAFNVKKSCLLTKKAKYNVYKLVDAFQNNIIIEEVITGLHSSLSIQSSL